jgi:hypothetical protein
MPEQGNGFNNRDTARIGRSVRATERMKPASLGGQYTPRRGGGVTNDQGTVQGQCKIMITDHQPGWNFMFFVPMSD